MSAVEAWSNGNLVQIRDKSVLRGGSLLLDAGYQRAELRLLCEKSANRRARWRSGAARQVHRHWRHRAKVQLVSHQAIVIREWRLPPYLLATSD